MGTAWTASVPSIVHILSISCFSNSCKRGPAQYAPNELGIPLQSLVQFSAWLLYIDPSVRRTLAGTPTVYLRTWSGTHFSLMIVIFRISNCSLSRSSTVFLLAMTVHCQLDCIDHYIEVSALQGYGGFHPRSWPCFISSPTMHSDVSCCTV